VTDPTPDRLAEHIRLMLGVQNAGDSPDGLLLRRFTDAGDDAAFAALVRRHGPLVLGLCRRLLRSDHDAEDAFQATFLILARKARGLRKPGSVASWLYGVAYRVAGRLRTGAERRRARERCVAGSGEADAAPEPGRAELREVLDQELNRLPEKYRAPLVLCHLQGLTQEDAAGQLGWPRGTLKRRLERGRQLLGQSLTRRGLAPAAGLASLTGAAAEAALPGPLCAAAARGATLLTRAARAAVPDRITDLVQGVLNAMLLTKLKQCAVLVLLAGLTLAVGGLLTRQVLFAGPQGNREAPAAGVAGKPEGPNKVPAPNQRTDQERVDGSKKDPGTPGERQGEKPDGKKPDGKAGGGNNSPDPQKDTVPADGKVKGFVKEWKGAISGAKKRERLVVRTKEQWQRVWAQAHATVSPRPKLPEVDFGRHMVLAVFMGEQPSGGYAVTITEATVAKEAVMVRVRERAPSPNTITPPVITSPWHFAVMPRFERAVKFVDD
jgi:RNA polymerase sigma factor (sigma-70 family)